MSEGSAWTVGLSASNLDGAAAILGANQWATPPAAGERFVIATLTVTVSAAAASAQGGDITTEGIDPSQSLSVEFVGGNGISYDGLSGTMCYTNTPFYSVGSLYSDGATVSGDFCIAVPEEAIDGGLWRIANIRNDGVWVATA